MIRDNAPKEVSWLQKISDARREVYHDSDPRDPNGGYRVSTCTSRTLVLLLDHAEALEQRLEASAQRLEDIAHETRAERLRQISNDEY
jgi:hypothetical protein